jgi:hypothetical protein
VVIDRGAARAQGELVLDRKALNLGQSSDPTADWVSEKIGVTIDVSARLAQ